MKKISIGEFLSLARQYPVLDVRSPAEFKHAHIPGAYNLPLFSDEERKVVGTAYKQEGREQAIKIGLDYFGVKMRKMIEEAEVINSKFKTCLPAGRFKNSKTASSNLAVDCELPTANCILVHCWRGGMRSAGVAWLLDLYGFKVYTLAGGYKSFRNLVLGQFEKPYSFKVLGGYTGAGKTEVLKGLEKEKQLVIDMEGMAHHKGSAFGALGQEEQPTQEMFENELGLKLMEAHLNTENSPIWLEDESNRIGSINLPQALWKTMRMSPVYFLDVPFEKRLEHITEEYGKFEKKELVGAVWRIQKRLGGLNAKESINYLLEGNNKECFRILLRYYDKYYAKGLQERRDNNTTITVIPCEDADAGINIQRLLKEKIIV